MIITFTVIPGHTLSFVIPGPAEGRNPESKITTTNSAASGFRVRPPSAVAPE